MDLFVALQSVTMASSSDVEASLIIGIVLLVLPFVVGILLYRAMYRRYRNHDKRYQFEHTTTAIRSNLRRWDTYTRENKRQRNSEITGRNDDNPLVRAPRVAVNEVATTRQAQEARMAQEPRLAQEARVAEPERVAQDLPDFQAGTEPGVGPGTS